MRVQCVINLSSLKRGSLWLLLWACACMYENLDFMHAHSHLGHMSVTQIVLTINRLGWLLLVTRGRVLPSILLDFR